MVHINSIDSYKKLIAEKAINKSQQLVILSLGSYGPQTRRQLAESTGLELSSVCGRVSELKKKAAISEFKNIISDNTGRRISILKLNEMD